MEFGRGVEGAAPYIEIRSVRMKKPSQNGMALLGTDCHGFSALAMTEEEQKALPKWEGFDW